MKKVGRRLLRDDRAVTEVIGYVLSFALSAIFLLVALNLFYTAKGNTEDVVAAVELRSISDRVATRVIEAGLVSQEFPNASLSYTIFIPQSLDGRPYYVGASPSQITAATVDGILSAATTTYKLEVVPDIVVKGVVQSSAERVLIRYSQEWDTSVPPKLVPTITISGE